MATIHLNLVWEDWGEPVVEVSVQLTMECSSTPKLATLAVKLRRRAAYKDADGYYLNADGTRANDLVWIADEILDTEGGTSPSPAPITKMVRKDPANWAAWAAASAPPGATLALGHYYVKAEGKGATPCQTAALPAEWVGPGHLHPL